MGCSSAQSFWSDLLLPRPAPQERGEGIDSFRAPPACGRSPILRMNTVPIGIIGMGNIGKHHADYLLAGKVPRCQLTAVCSTSPHKLELYRAKGLRIFDRGEKLLESGEMDAVIIATPHYQHTSLGIAALEAGLHLMVEKPISAHKADAERLIAMAKKHPDQIFAG